MKKEEFRDNISDPGFKIDNDGLYRSIFENVHDGIYQSTIDGRILSANPALVKMLGYSSEDELKCLNVGKDVYYSEEDRVNYLARYDHSSGAKDAELTLKRKDGTPITVLDNSHAVRDKDGNFLFFEGTLTEITDLKSTEKALRESEDRYRTLIETLQTGLSLFTLDGKLLYCNNRKREMMGYESEEEIMSVSLMEMIHPDDHQKVGRLRKELISKGSIKPFELRILRKDGSFFWADFVVSLIFDDEGNPSCMMDTMTDITEKKQADEQQMVLKHSVDVHYDGAYWLDTDNRFVYVNNSACRDTGYKREELIGKELSFVNPLATSDVVKLIWDKLRKDGSFTAEAVHRRKNGSIFPVEIVSSYINYNGKEYCCGFARDISDRKQTAEEMKNRLVQLRQIIDLVPSYIFAKDIDGKFLLSNKALAEVFGLSPEEIQGKSDEDYGASKEQIRWYRKHDLEVIKNGIPVFIPEEQVLRKDGSLGWFQTVKIPYKHPGYDKPAILGVSTEITDRKKVEDELRASETRFRKLFESHSAMKLLIDPESGMIIDVNKAASDFFGWPIAKLRKMSISEISAIPEPDVLANLRKVMSFSSATFETQSRMSDGSIRDTEVYASIIRVDGKDYLHSILHDITEKKKILHDLVKAKEKAEESDKIKTAFLHNISHEIRTPMNAIVGFSSLLDSPDLDDDSRGQYLEIIKHSSNQLLSIISDIVDISNLDAGQVRLVKEEIAVNDLLKQIHEQYRLRADEKKILLTLTVPKDRKNRVIITDPTKLIQIISNLLNNSFKFTKKGKIDFGYAEVDNFLEFYVSDTGSGIRKENRSRIFERFFQEDNPSNLKTEGTGLGLSICKGYVELMGGKISVESRYNKGTVFRFTIPLETAANKKSLKGK
jgi:PAS domain S-box-containing protein